MMAKTFGQLGMQLGSISIASICCKIINNICRQRKRPEQMFPKAETANLRRPSKAAASGLVNGCGCEIVNVCGLGKLG